MARAFLINTVRGTFGVIGAGTEIDDQSRVGLELWASARYVFNSVSSGVTPSASQ